MRLPATASASTTRALALGCAAVLLGGALTAALKPGSSSPDALRGPVPSAPARVTAPAPAPAKAAPRAKAPKATASPRTTSPATRARPVAPRPAPPRSAALAPLGWRSGAYSGDSLAEHKAFGAWRGRPIGSALWFMAQDSWAAMENPTYWTAEHAKDPSVLPVLSYAMWPAGEPGGSLETAAAGDNDDHWVRIAQNLVAQGLPDAVIRPGWEFNGNWYPWSALTDAGAARFAAAFRHIVDSMRSVEGQQFRFSWNPVASGGGIDPAKAYPGDDYVDDVGLDLYDVRLRPGLRGAALWDSQVRMKHGLAWHRRFAADHGKQVSYPEWGAFARPATSAGAGGDDPVFLSSMFAWMRAVPPAYENYFDHDTADGSFYGLHTPGSVLPASARTYKSLWGR